MGEIAELGFAGGDLSLQCANSRNVLDRALNAQRIVLPVTHQLGDTAQPQFAIGAGAKAKFEFGRLVALDAAFVDITPAAQIVGVDGLQECLEGGFLLARRASENTIGPFAPVQALVAQIECPQAESGHLFGGIVFGLLRFEAGQAPPQLTQPIVLVKQQIGQQANCEQYCQRRQLRPAPAVVTNAGQQWQADQEQQSANQPLPSLGGPVPGIRVDWCGSRHDSVRRLALLSRKAEFVGGPGLSVGAGQKRQRLDWQRHGKLTGLRY